MNKIGVRGIARVCHEANRAYCYMIGDHSQVGWDDAPPWQQESAVNGVQAIVENLSMTPEESHINWKMEKEAHGWKYGPVKDAEKKEHPCMVPYHKLPEEQRVKDRLFGEIVRAFL